MKIVVLGATGNIGSHVVKEALSQGHEVVAYVRNPDAVQRRAGLTVVQGSLDDPAALAKAFAGSDAVISAIGVALRAKKPIDLMQRTLPVITAAAQDAGVERFVLVSAFGVGDTAAKASFLGRLVYKTVVAAIFKDKELSEQSLPASGLNWTIVHPVNLKEAPAVPAVAIKRLDQVAKVPGLPTLPFANVARALVEIAGDRALAGQRVLVTTEKGWKPQGHPAA
ncbi:SDR family oxidoreductase [Streptomyces phaeofaciens JCM 4814]|uniref:NADH-flavin reductase n=1 Tax=Streptomyces phaeofaciens TaxID=68254 RepID=A0A918HM34_9ACTN|nr:NAD(P)-binding oxidoreductase [Streptomyces phaeofaciens]GGT71477.1 NADH-flavin reductase [Streptomyces phaeofaciens]